MREAAVERVADPLVGRERLEVWPEGAETGERARRLPGLELVHGR